MGILRDFDRSAQETFTAAQQPWQDWKEALEKDGKIFRAIGVAQLQVIQTCAIILPYSIFKAGVDTANKYLPKLARVLGIETTETQNEPSRDVIAQIISVNRYVNGVNGTNSGLPSGEIRVGNKKINVNSFMDKTFGSSTLRQRYERALDIQDETMRAKELSEIDQLLAEQIIKAM